MNSELGVHPWVFYLMALALVLLGAVYVSTEPHAIHYIAAGGLVGIIGGLVQHLLNLKRRLNKFEQRIQVLELFRKRIDARLVDEALGEDLPPAASVHQGWIDPPPPPPKRILKNTLG